MTVILLVLLPSESNDLSAVGLEKASIYPARRGLQQPDCLCSSRATGKKLALPLPPFEQEPQDDDLTSATDSSSSDSQEPDDSVGNMLGLRLVDCQNLLRVVQKYAKCDECGAPMEVREDLACRKGLVTKMFFFCTSCMKEDLFCNPYSNEDVKSVNAKSVLAARMAGMGRDGLSCFLGIMGLPQPVTPRAFSSHNQRLWELSNSEAEKSLHQAAANLHHAAGAAPEMVFSLYVLCLCETDDE